MAWVYIEDLGKHVGAEVTLRGWLYNRRSSGKVHFLLIRDGTGICQCVASINDLGAEAFAVADHLGQETSLEVSGIVREDKRAPGGRELPIACGVTEEVDPCAPAANRQRRKWRRVRGTPPTPGRSWRGCATMRAQSRQITVATCLWTRPSRPDFEKGGGLWRRSQRAGEGADRVGGVDQRAGA